MGGGHGGDGPSTTYKGLTLPHPKRWHSLTGKGMCAMMWFWVFYRAKQDGPVVLGWRHPWEGHEDHADDHGHGHETLVDLLACE
ncbi:hypothetical protein RHMOL_Rhmol07G0319600 [Rhododendron molle]|uniref:Uncharacterized protein n=1 Tax=Rhododendron molle TaxID=49168 RepID=A0ACC0N7G1_RHOML|nr:hypothetical protein RHMOL_Rhmol07G0319600 [Rhododendron molle]